MAVIMSAQDVRCILHEILLASFTVCDVERKVRERLNFEGKPMVTGLPYHSRDAWQDRYKNDSGSSVTIWWGKEKITVYLK